MWDDEDVTCFIRTVLAFACQFQLLFFSHIHTLKCLSNVHCAFIFESFYQTVIEFRFLSLPHTWLCRYLPPHQCLDYPAVQYTRYSTFSLYPALCNSPPINQNYGWRGQLWATYSTVFPIEIVIITVYHHHHLNTLLSSAEFSL